LSKLETKDYYSPELKLLVQATSTAVEVVSSTTTKI